MGAAVPEAEDGRGLDEHLTQRGEVSVRIAQERQVEQIAPAIAKVAEYFRNGARLE